MCGTFRHYLVWSLAIVHSVLWTGAAIWHQVTCSHNLPISSSELQPGPTANRTADDRSPYDRVRYDRTSIAGVDSSDCQPAAFSLCACGHGSPYSGQSHQPAHPQPHDSSHCLICQWLAQSHTAVTVVSIQTSPPFVQAAYSAERASVIAVPLFDCQIRGPPAC